MVTRHNQQHTPAAPQPSANRGEPHVRLPVESIFLAEPRWDNRCSGSRFGPAPAPLGFSLDVLFICAAVPASATKLRAAAAGVGRPDAPGNRQVLGDINTSSTPRSSTNKKRVWFSSAQRSNPRPVFLSYVLCPELNPVLFAATARSSYWQGSIGLKLPITKSFGATLEEGLGRSIQGWRGT